MSTNEQTKKSTIYFYGAAESDYGPGCQPENGFLYAKNDFTGMYYNILVYDRRLSKHELLDYGLYFLGAE